MSVVELSPRNHNVRHQRLEVALVDSGGANIGSVRYALERLGIKAGLTVDADAIASASHVILPGVGAAAPAMARLREHGLDKLIPRLTQPVLGICLGLQLLHESTAESDVDCLGILSGRAERFTVAPGRPVPHMGWNSLALLRPDPLLSGMAGGDWAYFVHSYALSLSEATIAACDYGGPFAAINRWRNFAAAQFHPERSSTLGLRLLKNFLES